MADPVLETLIRQLHAQPVHIAVVVTGGGSGAIAELLAVPGGSHVLVDAQVPYSAAALDRYLNSTPEQYCDEATARLMAMRAFQVARDLSAAIPRPSGESPRAPVGIACTASLASDVPKKGAHRVHVAWQTAATTATASLEFNKGQRSRRDEENLVARLVLNQLATGCGLEGTLPLELYEPEQIIARRADAPSAWQNLLFGQTAAVRCGGTATTPATSRVVFPGAFHPLHVGHLRMAQVAEELIDAEAEFEISVTNVDKPPLDYIEMAQRAAQFVPQTGEPGPPLWFTRAPTFVEKCAIFPGAKFVVGADTIARIADAKYYNGNPQHVQQAITEIAAYGCSFLVFGRTVAGRFLTLSDLSLPPELRQLCTEVPASRFHEDISSTELRRQQSRAAEGP